MVVVPSYGTSTALASGSLNGLADDAFWISERIDFSGSGFLPVFTQIHVAIQTTVTAGSSNGLAKVFLAEGLTTAGLSGGAGSTQGVFAGLPTDSEAAENMLLMGIIKAPAEDTVSHNFAIDLLLPSFITPKFGSVVVQNFTGAALSTAGNSVEIAAHQVLNS